MSRTIRAGTTLGAGLVAVLTLAGVSAAASRAEAQEQEREEECWSWYGPAEWNDMRPKLGVWISRSDNGGVRLVGVMADGPAGRAGMVEGDVIVSVDGHDLSEPLEGERDAPTVPGRSPPEERLTLLVSEAREGEAMTLVVRRGDERMTLEVAPEVLSPYGGRLPCTDEQRARMRGLGEQWYGPTRRGEVIDRIGLLSERFRDPQWRLELDSAGWVAPRVLRFSPDTLAAGTYGLRFGGPLFGDLGRHGLDLVELNPGLGAYFGTSEGVLVADVEGDSPLGLRPGDVVVAVEGRVVDDIDELHRILGSYEDGEEIVFRIYRDGAETTVAGTIS